MFHQALKNEMVPIVSMETEESEARILKVLMIFRLIYCSDHSALRKRTKKNFENEMRGRRLRNGQ